MTAGDPDPTDAEIEARLRAAPAAAWNQLRQALEALEAEDVHGTWRGGERLDDGSIAMPWMDTSGVVLRAASAAAGVGAIVVFAWPQWSGLDRYRDPTAFTGAPIADVARALTAMVRSDRFSEGSLAGAADAGLLQAAILRLLDWREELAAEPMPRGTGRENPSS